MAEKVALLLGNGTNCFPWFVGIKGKEMGTLLLCGLIWLLLSDTLSTGYQHLPLLKG